eukprot:TRINITY_DN27627_c0_g1_i2.p1 TRINITY_DN27627_c0_g1~~TRINITY_DN27627_c0_g1_i2.p1  ORF type:complete len:547 (-),score=76.71 TRINITY_DN27627_c0_g1_i2:91-1731(-)
MVNMSSIPAVPVTLGGTELVADLKRSKPTCREVATFDKSDIPNRCLEMMQRITQVGNQSILPSWKWDIIAILEESQQQLQDARKANTDIGKASLWQEIYGVVEDEDNACTVPDALQKQCNELLGRREKWIHDFNTELESMVSCGRGIRERLLFEDMDRAGWFGAFGVSPSEAQSLLERHIKMHHRVTRLARELKNLSRSLQRQGVLPSHRRALQATTIAEKLQSSLACLAEVNLGPAPGSREISLALSTVMWLDKPKSWQHAVYEHPRETYGKLPSNHFESRAPKAWQSLIAWLDMPSSARKNCVLIHNASFRRIIVRPYLVNAIDGSWDPPADWTVPLHAHFFGKEMNKALTLTSRVNCLKEKDPFTIGAQRMAVVALPPKADMNWSLRGVFFYGDTKIGDCNLCEDSIFSFLCVGCGIRVHDIFEECSQTSPAEHLIERKDDATDEKAACSGNESDRIEVVNHTEGPIDVKIFEPDGSQDSDRAPTVFRNPLARGTVVPHMSRSFMVKVSVEGETDYDVEIRSENRRAKCEVVGGQVIFVDKIL